jgi:ATP-dependent DNA helicase DinG
MTHPYSRVTPVTTTHEPQHSVSYAEVEAKMAELIPGYERRLPQVALAELNSQALADGFHLLAEAGCGTGKSFANLIPSILWTTAGRSADGEPRRVVYATATKALQDQITDRDLPNLQNFFDKHFGIKFNYALLKGRSNYLCINRARSVDPSEVADLGAILRIAEDLSFGGEKADFEAALGHEIPFGEWAKVRAESDNCSVHSCSQNKECFAAQARLRASTAHIVVVNHAVLFADLLFFNALIGEYSAVIFDEAHEAREYARSALGNEFTEGSLRGLLAEARNLVNREYSEHAQALLEAQRDAVGAQTALFASFDDLPQIKSGQSTARLGQADIVLNQDGWADFILAIQVYAGVLARIAPQLDTMKSKDLLPYERRLQILKKRSANLAAKVTDLVLADFDELVRWVTVEGPRNDRKRVINSCPIDVGPWLRENLWENVTAILTSATLQVSGKFDFIARQLGLDSYRELNVGTPFNFTEQAITFVPNLPDPSRERAAFDNAAVNEIRSLVTASNGRALVLFTSIKAMRDAHAALEGLLPFTCLMQGQAPNKVLAAQFAADTHSVLFATRSFMTGVDFQGETLSLVIIDKLPFPVPTEPLFEAEAEWLERRGGNAFTGLSVPMMSLIMSQAAGRLIRHRSDRGVIAILDPRICSKGYGKRILKTLPPAPLVRDLAAVKGFFGAS